MKKVVKKNKGKITRKMLLAEVVDRFPELVETLTLDYGLHCVSCFAANMETIEDGAMAHGMTDKEIDQMVDSLNKIVDKKN